MTIESPNNRTAMRLSFIAALSYNSWPLAYFLNRSVLQHGLASDLEKFNQPYSWIFIACDVLAGVLLVIAACLQYPRATYRLLRLEVLAYGSFGLVLISAALMPIGCQQVMNICVERLTSPASILHSSLSIGSIMLLASGVMLSVVLRRVVGEKGWRMQLLVLTATGMPVLGALGLVDIVNGNKHNELQYIFIVVTSLAILQAVNSSILLAYKAPPCLSLRTLGKSIRKGRSFYP